MLGALFVIPLEGWLWVRPGAEAPGSHLIALGAILVLASPFMRRGLVGMIQTIGTRVQARRAKP
jgi:branched-chain amino acid transport system permease protein